MITSRGPDPRPATLATVCIEKVIRTPRGVDTSRYGSGFFYRGPGGTIWIVTNWHVLTGRHPSDPGMLLGQAPSSPSAINVAFPLKRRGHFSAPLKVELYHQGRPVWRQYKLDVGVDIAAIPTRFPPRAAGIAIQDFNLRSSDPLEPGIDLVVIGYPFKQSSETRFALWKRGMLASEPGFPLFGHPQMFIDVPGTQGMSGSPVFKYGPMMAVDQSTRIAMDKFYSGEVGALEALDDIDVSRMKHEAVGLTFVGIYAGSTADSKLERLQLGRMFSESLVNAVVAQGEAGSNPFPPDDAA